MSLKVRYQIPLKHKKNYEMIWDQFCRSEHIPNFTSSYVELKKSGILEVGGEVEYLEDQEAVESSCYACEQYHAGANKLCSVCSSQYGDATEEMKVHRENKILQLKKSREEKEAVEFKFPEEIEVEFIDNNGDDSTVILSLKK